jgi:hypothetical protein
MLRVCGRCYHACFCQSFFAHAIKHSLFYTFLSFLTLTGSVITLKHSLFYTFLPFFLFHFTRAIEERGTLLAMAGIRVLALADARSNTHSSNFIPHVTRYIEEHGQLLAMAGIRVLALGDGALGDSVRALADAPGGAGAADNVLGFSDEDGTGDEYDSDDVDYASGDDDALYAGCSFERGLVMSRRQCPCHVCAG